MQCNAKKIIEPTFNHPNAPSLEELKIILNDVPKVGEDGTQLETFKESDQFKVIRNNDPIKIKYAYNFLVKMVQNPEHKEIDSCIKYFMWALKEGKGFTDSDVEILDYVLECIETHDLRDVGYGDDFVFNKQTSKEIRFTDQSFVSFKEKFDSSFLPFAGYEEKSW